MEFTDRFAGQEATLTFLVEDVFGAGPQVLMDALRAPAIPRIGDLFEGSNILATSRTVTNVEDCTTKWEVVVRYGETQGAGGPFDNPPSDQVRPTLELDSTVVMKRTNIDANGDPIRIDDYRAIDYDENGVPLGLNPEPEPAQGGMVDVPVVLTVLRYMRRELPIGALGSVADKSKAFTGKTNSVDIDRSGEHTWLCTRLGAVTDDRGLTYNMTYEFTFDIDRWRATVAYIDPKTGQPGGGIGFQPTGVINGVKTFQVVGSADFHLLDLHL
jgi:hypothetical protein